MNEKAAVSKELNEKHRKILDGLLRIPENRECADCKSLGPRWASVNLGIFICMRCSGIHRSLGVHISKVRSATLDTWLPNQVIFIQSMGNEKSNAYWEADLPPNHDRVQIENFIRAKYVEKRWIPRDRKVKSPARIKEEVTSAYRLRPWSGDEHGDGNKIKKHHPYTGEKYSHPPSTVNKEVAILAPISRPGSVGKQRGSDNDERRYLEKADNNLSSKYGLVHDTRSAIAVPHIVSGLATGHQRSDEFMQRSGPVALKIEPAAANSMPVVRSPKDDYAAELFRIIFMGDSKEDSKNSVTDSIAWVEFDSDEAAPTEEEKISSKSSEVEIQLTSKVEYISKDATSLTQHCSQEPQKDLKNKNPDPFDKSDTMDTYSIHHRRLAMLAQDEPFHMASLAISCNGAQKDPSHYVHQPRANGIHREAPQTQMPIAKIQTFRPANFTGSIVPYTTTSRIYRPATLFNSSATSSAKRPPSALPVSGHDYDFSHLTRGLFRRQ